MFVVLPVVIDRVFILSMLARYTKRTRCPARRGCAERRLVQGRTAMTIFDKDFNRRRLLKGGAMAAAGLAAPSFFVRGAWAKDFRNNPANAKSIKLGFNVPQTGPSADEGADELKAFKLRSEEHTSELQSLMRISYAVFCLKKKKRKSNN